ncbi:MAG: hypothetical protein LBG80_19110 [Bacteroidales bacterium]|jgi:hypothetical protein|nr:hypothetical protein [Bacteroidales bacterium]
MAKRTKKELSQMGKKITAEAKRIRKAHPSMKWQTAMKQAGKNLRGKL